MKFNFVFALAAVLACAPVASTFAAEKAEKGAKAEKAAKTEKAADKAVDKEAAAEKVGPSEADIAKAKKLLKMRGGKPFPKFGEAKALAEKGNFPIVVMLLLDRSTRNVMSETIQKSIMMRKEFKEFASQNFVLISMNLKLSKDGKGIDTRSIRDVEALKFIENFALDEKLAGQLKQQGKPELKPTDLNNYPAIIVMDPLCQKQLFRAGKVDMTTLKENPKAVFGVWITQFADFFRSAGIEPTVSPALQKILDDPTGENSKKK